LGLASLDELPLLDKESGAGDMFEALAQGADPMPSPQADAPADAPADADGQANETIVRQPAVAAPAVIPRAGSRDAPKNSAGAASATTQDGPPPEPETSMVEPENE